MKTRSVLPLLAAVMLWPFGHVVYGSITFTNIHGFVNYGTANGWDSQSALVQHSNGYLYGTTCSGGANNEGTIFRINTNGSVFATVASFNILNGGYFGGSHISGLTEGTDGNLYGTTQNGGAGLAGEVFQYSSSGLNILYSFTGGNDGDQPTAGLVLGVGGNFYGTTTGRGYWTFLDPTGVGYGTIFTITLTGTLTTLHSFSGTDGRVPLALVQGKDGNLYGTTQFGGTYGFGTVFKITTNGLFSTLYSFTGANDGAEPGGLAQGQDGNFYGATYHRGAFTYLDSSGNGFGTIYKITTNGVLTTLVSFNNTNGANPDSELVLGGDGNFYGTTYSGLTAYPPIPGVIQNFGTVFQMTPAGAITTVVSFDYMNGYGAYPNGVMLATDGNLYGTCQNGGTYFGASGGIIFRLTLPPTDRTPPTIIIGSPTAGQVFNTSSVAVSGTAADPGTPSTGVSLVQVQVNGTNGTWQTASGTTAWNASVALSSGANTIYARSQDGASHYSTIASVSVTYNPPDITPPTVVISSPTSGQTFTASPVTVSGTATDPGSPSTGVSLVQVQVNGTGGTWQTASGTTSWSASAALVSGTNTIYARSQDGAGHYSTNATVSVTYNPPDTTPPTVSISAPTAGQHMTNALATFVGKASDNLKVASVWYQINSNAWNLVTSTTNSYTNWTQTVTLITGSNTFKTYALDFAGNSSITQSLSVLSSNTFKLQLAFTNALPMKTNGLVFSLQLSKGLNGHIQVSSNLTSWVTLTNFVGTNTTLNFRDPAATNSSRRFYRAVVP
jgi:uncharacterized repeat protein (TIGR03803 family)